MQESFGFAADDLTFIRQVLVPVFGRLPDFERREPLWRMVRSLIGSQTYDRVAEGALERLMARWPDPNDLACADVTTVERAIHDVTHADKKAAYLVSTIQWIGRERPDYNLSFLQHWPVYQALAWLERFDGVGPKVSAATLSASTLRMRVFIVDSHVHRILLRFGFIDSRASAEDGRDSVTAAVRSFDADDLLELFRLMKRLGQTLCRPFQVHCEFCPLAPRCQKKSWLGVPAEREPRLTPAQGLEL